jgi:hypothetical protein
MKYIFLLIFTGITFGIVQKYSTYDPKKIVAIHIPLTNGFDMLITDDMLVNSMYNWAQTMRFFESYKGNILTIDERILIFNTAKKYHLNILALCTRIELESGIIAWGQGHSPLYEYRKKWCLGAGMYETIISNGVHIKPWVGFQRQLERGASCLRNNFNAWVPGMKLKINEGTLVVQPRNAATYALYRYAPYWGTWRENGVVCSGQEYFIVVYRRMKNRWDEVNK